MDLGIYHFAAGIRMGGGKPVYTREMSRALAEQCDVTLYTAAPAFDHLHESGAEVVELPSWRGHALHRRLSRKEPIRLNSTLSYMKARRDGLNERINDHDVLVTHKWYEDLVISRTVDTPVIYQRHGVGNHGVGSTAHSLLARPMWNIANSEPTQRELERQRGFDIDGVVRPGVDTARFHPDADPAFESEVPTVLFVGRFEHVKGVKTLLEGFAPLADRARLLYLGDGSERETLVRRSRKLGIDDAVDINGVVPHRKTAGYYAAADIVCHPSRYEGFGMTNLEAMASGAAVVTTPFGFVEEFGARGETHVEVPPGNSERLTAEMERLLDAQARRKELGENARELAVNHTWDERADRMLTLCERFLDER